jgi:ribonuclease BN (tRNA processing enzyme)
VPLQHCIAWQAVQLLISDTVMPPAAASALQTSHITPQQAGGIFAAAQPRLAVAHHLTVNAASRAAIIQDIRQGYPQV